MKFIFYIWLCILSACAVNVSPKYTPPTPPRVEMHADTAFTTEERKEIQAAANLWSDQTSDTAHIDIKWDLDFNSVSSLKESEDKDWNVIVRLTSDLDAVKEIDCEAAEQRGLPCGLPCGFAPCVLAWVDPAGGFLMHRPVRMHVIVDRSSGAVMRQIVLHEFGHVLGLPHSPAPSAVMYPSHHQHNNVCLTQPDLNLFCSVNVCKKEMKPCDG